MWLLSHSTQSIADAGSEETILIKAFGFDGDSPCPEGSGLMEEATRR